jgi:hypothetical protein
MLGRRKLVWRARFIAKKRRRNARVQGSNRGRKAVVQPIYHSIIDGMRGIFKYHEKLAGCAEVVESVTFWRVTKGMSVRARLEFHNDP